MWTWRKIGIAVLAAGTVVGLMLIIVDQLVLPWVVSSSSTVEVPQVVGQRLSAAEEQLRTRGLQVNDIRRQFSSEYKAGTVMSQLPYPGAIVKEGRRVYLTVSKGMQQVTVPNVIGLTIRDARVALLRSGLQLGSISTVSSTAVPANAIAWQSIPSGSSSNADAVVSVGVSNGGVVSMPQLIGLSIDDARLALSGLGLEITSVTERPTKAFAPGTVIEHAPPADSALQPGQTISVTLAR
jgi:serine/threonine-protein kinase